MIHDIVETMKKIRRIFIVERTNMFTEAFLECCLESMLTRCIGVFEGDHTQE